MLAIENGIFSIVTLPDFGLDDFVIIKLRGYINSKDDLAKQFIMPL